MSDFASAIKSFITDSLKMNVWVFLVHLVCAMLIIGCVCIWVWKPTNDFIAIQKKKLDKQKNDLVVNNRETRYFLRLLKKEKNELFYTKRAITKAAVEEAERIRIEARTSMERVVNDMKAKAEERIAIMEQKAKEQIKQNIVDSAVELTERLIGANMNVENNKLVIDAYIKELEERRLSSSEDRKLSANA